MATKKLIVIDDHTGVSIPLNRVKVSILDVNKTKFKGEKSLNPLKSGQGFYTKNNNEQTLNIIVSIPLNRVKVSI